jgi:AcrR family transcriptional regulator
MTVKLLDPIAFQARKDTILRRARHLFATRGFAETSMDGIAKACDIQKASLYHYFESKQRLLQELVDTEAARWAAHLKVYERGRTFDETLRLIGTTFLKEIEEDRAREFCKITMFESHKNPSILKALKESPTHNRKGFYAVFAKHLDGKMPRKQISMVITQFMGGLIHYASLSRLRGENMCYEPYEDAEYVDQLVNIFVKGIH